MNNTTIGIITFSSLVAYKALLYYGIHRSAQKEKRKEVVDMELYKSYKDYIDMWNKK